MGFYIYDNTVSERAKLLKPSKRGELEITDLNLSYHADEQLYCNILSRNDFWIDAGTISSLYNASNFIQLFDNQLNLKIGVPEEASYRMGNINAEKLLSLAYQYSNSAYGAYLKKIID